MKQVVIFADRREQVLRQVGKWWRCKGYKKKSGNKFSKNSKNTARLKEVVLHRFERHEHCESNETKKTRRTRS
jgi:hypothetical protein